MLKFKEKKYLVLAAVLLSLAFLLTACSNSDSKNEVISDDPYSVQGQVVNLDGEGVAGVTVTAENSGVTETTDADGRWTLSALEGNETINITNSSVPETINVSSESKNIDFLTAEMPDHNLSSNEIEQAMTKLTSDQFGGRLTGSAGNELTEDYLAEHFSELGFDSPAGIDNYRQSYSQKVIYSEANNSSKLLLKKESGDLIEEFEFLDDFMIQTGWSQAAINGEGKGVPFLYKNRDAVEQNGKIMLVAKESIADINLYNFGFEIKEAGQNGVEAIIIERNIDNRNRRIIKRMVRSPYSDSTEAPVVYFVSSAVFEQLNQENVLIELEANYLIEERSANNIIAYVEGSTDQNLLITAHFDGLGKSSNGEIYPSALDNGSGTAALMEIARQVALIEQVPEKNLVFIAFNGEEQGLYGSGHYHNNPVVDLDKSTVLNLDMIGSASSKEDDKLRLIRSVDGKKIQQKLKNILGVAYKLETVSTEGPGSDHVHFDNAVSILDGDDRYYHSELDDLDRIDVERMKKIIKSALVYIYN